MPRCSRSWHWSLATSSRSTRSTNAAASLSAWAIRSNTLSIHMRRLTYRAGRITKRTNPDGTKALLHRVLHLIIDHLLLHRGQLINQLLALGLLIHHRHVQVHNHSLVVLKLQLLILKLLPQIDKLIIALVHTVLNRFLLLINLRILFLQTC